MGTALAIAYAGGVLAAPICTGDKQIPPIYLMVSTDDSLFTVDAVSLARTTSAQSPNKSSIDAIEIQRRSVDIAEARELCRLGYSVSTLDFIKIGAADTQKRRDEGRKFSPIGSLPSSFTIGATYISGYGTYSYGNFWVPASMPSGHSNQWSAYDVVTSNFATADPGTHLVHSIMWDTTYPSSGWNNGKGVIAAHYANACNPGGYGPTAVMESWSPAPSTEVWGPVSGWGATPLQNTCSFQFSDGVSYGFLTGADNTTQWQSYSQYYSGSSSPFYSSSLNTYQSSFLTSVAGVAFLVAGPPVSPGVSWSLSFTGVSSGTY